VGINRWEYKSPSSALFDFAQHWIINVKDYAVEDSVELNLYHFTNFGASPEVVLYNFSAALFDFYKNVQHRTLQNDWNRFTNSFFRQKNASYNFEKDSFDLTEKKEVKVIQRKDFKIWYNSIYESLLANKSILKAILNWVSKKQRPLNFEIVKIYQINLRNMNAKTLQIIERIADYILQDTNDLKKKITSLRKPIKAYAFRKALRRLAEENLAKKNPNVLFSLDEYAIELFPDGTYWQEIQDLLLIAIYQKIHEQQLWSDGEDGILEEIEAEVETN
jgi:CRISPR-associated protein Cst1